MMSAPARPLSGPRHAGATSSDGATSPTGGTGGADPARPSEPPVLVRRDVNGVFRLTLNRPHAFNALSQSLLEALQRELDTVAEDPSARVVVLAAAGTAFCAGHDLKEMRAEPSQAYYEALFAQ